MTARLRTWFDARTPREQILLGAFALLGVVALYLVAVWWPLRAARAASIADIATYARLEARLRAAGPGLVDRPAALTGAPSAIVTGSAADAGLVIRRIDPRGATTLVTLEDAEFARIVTWLERIERDSRLRVVDATLTRRPAPGTVNAQIGFSG